MKLVNDMGKKKHCVTRGVVTVDALMGDDEDTDPPPRRHLSNPYARVSPHAREIIMENHGDEALLGANRGGPCERSLSACEPRERHETDGCSH